MSGKDIGLLGVCILSATTATVEFWLWIQTPINTPAPMKLVLSIVFLIVAVVCGLLFLIPRVNKEEEMHITQ